MGTMLLLVFILLALSFMLRKIFSKGTTWMKLHRVLTGLAFVLLILHLVEVGGFVGVDGVKAALQHDSLLNNPSVSEEITEAEISDRITEDSLEITEETDSSEASPQKEDTTNSNNTVTNETASTPEDTTPEAISDNSVAAEDTTSSGPYIDGTYTGTADGYRPGLTLEVVIENGYISSVEVIAHNEKNERFYGEPVEVIPQEIIAAQSTDVDIVTGATFTSTGIKNAVNNALANALK
jgi:uncharacterized protein with FMN-binding domain